MLQVRVDHPMYMTLYIVYPSLHGCLCLSLFFRTTHTPVAWSRRATNCLHLSRSEGPPPIPLHPPRCRRRGLAADRRHGMDTRHNIQCPRVHPGVKRRSQVHRLSPLTEICGHKWLQETRVHLHAATGGSQGQLFQGRGSYHVGSDRYSGSTSFWQRSRIHTHIKVSHCVTSCTFVTFCHY